MTSRRTDSSLASLCGQLPAHGEVITLSLTTAAATTASALTAGQLYDMVSNVDCYVCASASAGNDAAVTDYYLPADTIVPITLEGAKLYVSGIVAAGTGTLFISPRDPVSVVIY